MGRDLKILSYSIDKGFGFARNRFVLEVIREAIRKTEADAVLLQEVTSGRHPVSSFAGENWPDEAQFEYLADEIWEHFAYGRNAVFSDGDHGNAILSKEPILAQENIPVSTNRLEKRGILHVETRLPDGGPKLHLMTLHLNLAEKGRMRQLKSLHHRIDSHVDPKEPLIVGGDFNDWRGRITREFSGTGIREAHETLHGTHARTFPGFLPILPLDRIYYRNLVPVACERLHDSFWTSLSDHAAMVATFRLP